MYFIIISSYVILLYQPLLDKVFNYTLAPRRGRGGILFYLCPLPSLPEGGGGYTVLPLSVCPFVQDIFRCIFLSNCWWQKSDIWSQASYRYTILWVAFLDPLDSYFLFADLVGLYTHWTYMHIFRHIFLSNYWWQRSYIWSQVSLSVFGPIRFLLPVCRLSWFLYTLNIYAHFSSHFSQQLLMAEIWYLVTSFIYVRHIVGSVFEPTGFLLPVCRLCWFLYTLNIYAHFSSDSYFLFAKERGYHRWALAHSSSCLTWPSLEPMIKPIECQCSNHYTTNAVQNKIKKYNSG